MAKNIFVKLSIRNILIFAFIIRIILLPLSFHGDVQVNYLWGKSLSIFDWNGFYENINHNNYYPPDQPMLILIYDWTINIVFKYLSKTLYFLYSNTGLFSSRYIYWFFENGNQILLKFPMLIADILIIYFSYRFTLEKFSLNKAKIISVILSLYLPYTYNSSLWGSGDSIINLFALGSIYLFYQKKHVLPVIFYLTSIFFKPTLLIWFPIILIILIKQRTPILKSTLMLTVGVICLYIISTPFTNSIPLIWLFHTIKNQIIFGSLDYLTVNAMNLWALIYGFGTSSDTHLIKEILSIRDISLFICLFFYLIIIKNLYFSFNLKNVLLSMSQVTLVTFSFMTRMHERYSYSSLLPLLMLCLYDAKYIKYFVIFTITHTLNIIYSWWLPILNPIAEFIAFEKNIVIISIINVLCTICLVFTNSKYRLNGKK
ncbi:MAG TPA: hypothetical protein VN174_04810 [Candidatus Methanoperedens sp.]|nr:hypothetical protein [Candidatus Methanoperedens sp.]